MWIWDVRPLQDAHAGCPNVQATLTWCYHCGFESTKNKFKYYNNRKQTQPWYQCNNCQKFFTSGSNGYPEGRSYTKKWNVDPPKLLGLPQKYRCCSVANNAPFKYYYNKNLLQPRFKCLSCGQQFQMRSTGTGEERRLVHTLSYQRPTHNQKLGVASNIDNEICLQTSPDLWMLGLKEVKNFPALSEEDTQYLNLIEAGCTENEALPPEAVLRLQLWASKLPRSCCKRMPFEAQACLTKSWQPKECSSSCHMKWKCIAPLDIMELIYA